MDTLNTLISILSLTLGVAWASGINLYAAILTLGILDRLEYVALPPGLESLSDPVVITVAAVLFCVEFLADKIPGVDTGWDAIQTFIRIPAGAILAAGAVGDFNPAIVIAAGLVGTSVAATTHTAKAGTRLLINTSPEPVTNWFASFSEDLIVITGIWAALKHPALFLLLLLVFLGACIWLLPKVFVRVIAVWRGIVRFLKKGILKKERDAEEVLEKE